MTPPLMDAPQVALSISDVSLHKGTLTVIRDVQSLITVAGPGKARSGRVRVLRASLHALHPRLR